MIADSWLVPLLMVAVCVGAYIWAAGYDGHGPLAALGMTKTELQPQAVRLSGTGGDPLVILIAVPWTKDGYCTGQFTVHATETATEVHVGNVTSREYHRGECAGVGTDNNMAWVDVRLDSPLGSRVVIRDSDGARLPLQVGPP